MIVKGDLGGGGVSNPIRLKKKKKSSDYYRNNFHPPVIIIVLNTECGKSLGAILKLTNFIGRNATNLLKALIAEDFLILRSDYQTTPSEHKHFFAIIHHGCNILSGNGSTCF